MQGHVQVLGQEQHFWKSTGQKCNAFARVKSAWAETYSQMENKNENYSNWAISNLGLGKNITFGWILIKNTPAIVLHFSSRFQKSENLHTDSVFFMGNPNLQLSDSLRVAFDLWRSPILHLNICHVGYRSKSESLYSSLYSF